MPHPTPQIAPAGARGTGAELHRQKRTWIAPPRQLIENQDYRGLQSIAQIRSDKENFTTIWYSLEGPGVNEPPHNVFTIDRNSGFIRVLQRLDREKIANYNLRGIARYTDGSRAEKDVNVHIKVVDENDCAPVVLTQQVGSVQESSAAGTVVMKVIATDADEANTAHTAISYQIVESSNAGGMFSIDSRSGVVTVRRTTLDRETKDTYKLMIQASDMNGAGGGNSGSGEVEIKLLDINDNVPTLERESYEGSVEENTVNMEVLRIKAVDMDMMYSDNWLAAYEFVSGNEGGYFTITTDAKTNEGIIMINKALDYEEIKTLNLGVAVSNKAAYNFGSGSLLGPETLGKSYPVKINVVNQKEWPRFQPAVKVVTVSEDHSSVSTHQVITTYTAIDSDTLTAATNVRYAKNRDVDNWLNIDVNTAEIRLNKLPDRESKYLINGTYYAEIICISKDDSSKTATGTIAIQVEDFNDHCPQLTATTQTMCLQDNVIYVTAVDRDEFPNSAPFEFSVVKGSDKSKWVVEPLNETSVILRDEANLWPGIHKVALEIKDQQGKSCADVQVIDLTVCTCHRDTRTCTPRASSGAEFGAAGILLLLLGLLLLLLIPCLLLFCLCGGTAALGDFKAIPFETKQQLISYHTEGQGEDKEVPLMHVPVEVDGGDLHATNVDYFGGKGYEMGGAGGGGGAGVGNTSTLMRDNMHLYGQYHQSGGMEEVELMGGGTMGGHDMTLSRYQGGAFDGMALSSHFLEEYYSSKSSHAAQQSQHKDQILVYDEEGRESPAGSVGCCSLLENQDDLSFLDDLGPKFRTLAEICQGSAVVTETREVDAGVSVPPVRPVSPVRPSTHTHVHTETLRERDRLGVTALGASNVATGSSTFIQEKFTERAQGVAGVPVSVLPSQTVLVQQPAMYYAAAPMYVVESKPQVMLVAGGAHQAVGQVGSVGLSHGLVQVGGLQGSQGLVLVDRQVGVGGAAGLSAHGLAQGTVSHGLAQGTVSHGLSQGAVSHGLSQGAVSHGLSQGVVSHGLVQGAVSHGLSQGAVSHGLSQGAVSHGLSQGAVSHGLAQGAVSRSKQVLLVENGAAASSSAGHVLQAGRGVEVRGQAKAHSFSVGSAGSHEDFAVAAAPMMPAGQRVVVQHKKVSVTERNVESSSRA